ncbi:Hypothetical protein A7982_10117 [Minicystis rosea]|nr:Hypothetical protein A7982_10117 [Minicystis rosea]
MGRKTKLERPMTRDPRAQAHSDPARSFFGFRRFDLLLSTSVERVS